MPLHTEVEKITAKEYENLYKLLIKHGVPESAAQKIIKFYQEEG